VPLNFVLLSSSLKSQNKEHAKNRVLQYLMFVLMFLQPVWFAVTQHVLCISDDDSTYNGLSNGVQLVVFVYNLCINRSATVTVTCAYIQPTCSERGYNSLLTVACLQTVLRCLLVPHRTVLTVLTQRPDCSTMEPVSVWKRSRRRYLERSKCSTFVLTAERFTGKAAIMRKCMRSFRTFCLRPAATDCDMSYVV